jgi:hypothetical protein
MLAVADSCGRTDTLAFDITYIATGLEEQTTNAPVVRVDASSATPTVLIQGSSVPGTITLMDASGRVLATAVTKPHAMVRLALPNATPGVVLWRLVGADGSLGTGRIVLP